MTDPSAAWQELFDRVHTVGVTRQAEADSPSASRHARWRCELDIPDRIADLPMFDHAGFPTAYQRSAAYLTVSAFPADHPIPARLRLYTELTWFTRARSYYASSAQYVLEQPVASAAPRAVEMVWTQTYPGSSDDVVSTLKQRQAIQANRDYHHQALAWLLRLRSTAAMLCMLTDADTGTYDPQQLAQLADWTRGRLPLL